MPTCRAIIRLAALAVPLLGAGIALAQQDPIAHRKEGLRRMQTNLEAIGAVARSGGNLAEAAGRADEMAAWFRTFPGFFPPGSDVAPSRALPTVWSDRPGFEAAAANAVRAAETLRDAAQSGNAAATNSAVQAMGGACGACHRGYRGR